MPHIELELYYRFISEVQELVEVAHALESAVDGEWGTDGTESAVIEKVEKSLRELGEG